jgi:hypothetical protein
MLMMTDVITPPHSSSFLLTPPHSSSLLLTPPHSSSKIRPERYLYYYYRKTKKYRVAK